ncbi:hypothetical protein [Mycobacterium marinum]|uniref:hypothetical protein n=1 Tax=Mycobacterium marinum TaxID=1781 RepID=UPI001595A6BA|nr:hypothetical protein [Mycobacterium marinum]
MGDLSDLLEGMIRPPVLGIVELLHDRINQILGFYQRQSMLRRTGAAHELEYYGGGL